MSRRLGAILALLGGAAWRRIRPARRAPVPPQTFAAPGGEVRLRRDDAGVAHVAADTLADAAFGHGIAIAQDRLWQLETLRRLAAGRLAELLGDRPVAGPRSLMPGDTLLAVDRLYRSLRMYPVAREELGLLTEDARRALEAFAAGVNRWVETLRPAQLPLEYRLLAAAPEPWRAEDSLAVGKLIGWLLSLSFAAKPVLAALAAEPVLAALLPPALQQGTCILGAPPRGAAGLDQLARTALGLAGPGVGSNSWVVAGSRTASGKPLLCNDPHLVFGLPALWYPVALSTPHHGVIGASLPGIPLVLIGRTRHLAWGFTAVMADDGDYYRETLDGEGRYRRGGEWRRVEVVEERFGVRGRAPAALPLRFVRHGGVLCPLFEAADGQPAASYRWVGLEPQPSFDAVLGIARARTVAEFERALARYGVPAQNALVADGDGHIAYVCAGRFPRRAAACAGAAMLDGAAPEHAWQGFLDPAEHPRSVDPPAGFLATANNRVAARLPPSLAHGFWEPPYRATRIAARLAECPAATADDMAEIQTDCVSLQAAGLVGALVGSTAASLTRPAARRAAGLLLAWDCAMRADAPAPVVFHLFYQALLARVVRPVCEARAPGLYQRYLSLLQLAVPAIDSLLLRADGAWFPHGVGETVEACLAEAWAEAERRLGTDPARWRWGALHTLTLHHGMGRGRQPLLRALVALFRLDRGPYPRPGDGMTVNLAAFPLVEPFGVVAGPSYRQIVDLGAPEESRWVLGGGVSGDPRSPHYADQIPAWLRGEYRPMRFLDAASSAKRDINETRSGAG